MKKIILLSLLALYCAHSFSQTTWFKIHDLGIYDEQAWVIVSNEESIYFLVTGFGEQVATRNMVVKLTKQGELVWTRFLEYPVSAHAELQFHFPKMLALAKDNSLYALSYAKNKDLVYEFLLNKFNENGDLVWAKTYGFPNKDVTSQAYGLALATDGLGVIMTGATFEQYPNQRYVIIRVDSAGNEQWKRLLPVPPNSIGETVPVVQMPDGAIKIAFDNGLVTRYQDYLMGLDSMGNIQYSYKDPFGGGAHDLKRHPNGNLVYLSNERNPPMHEWGGLRVQMLTPTFDTVWSRLFYDREFPYLFLDAGFVRNLSISPDGKILALGYNTNNCALVCYDANGTMLWKREVALEGFQALKFNYAAWAPDGGVLLDGYIYGGWTVDTRYAETFLMKLDEVGCLDADCSQTIITDTEEAGVTNEKPRFKAAPNPTDGAFTLLAPQNAPSRYTVRLYDQTGKLIFQENQSEPNTTFDLKGQAPGIYHLSITDKHGKHYVDKLVKVGQ